MGVDATRPLTKPKKKYHAGLVPFTLRHDKNFGDDPDAIAISEAVRFLRDEGIKKGVVPYAQLVEYPSDILRDRSDIDILFRLMKTHAFLHQLNRPIIDGYTIVATLKDYDFAFYLIASFLAGARLGIVGRAAEVWEYIKGKESVTSNEVSKAIPDITQPRASQILRGFHEQGLCTRDKLSGYAGYYYHPKDVKDLKFSIKKEIETQTTPIFVKEWFETKFKNIQPRVEGPTIGGKREQITLMGLWIYIIGKEKVKNENMGQKPKITQNGAQNSFLT